MKSIFLLLVLVLAACTTPLKPQPAGTTQSSGTQGNMDYVVTKLTGVIPTCTLLYMHGVDEDQNAVRSTKYPHDELIPMAKKLGCSILVPSYGSIWLLGADIKPSLCLPFTKCLLAPSVDQFLSDLSQVMTKNNLPSVVYAEGVSQGGFNLSTLAMKKPAMFKKVIIAHPVMLFQDLAPATFLAFTNFTPLRWLQVNPVNVIKLTTAMPSTYVTTCKADALVPSDATQEFYRIGKSKGFDFTLHIDAVGCKHGQFDEAPAMDWITKQ